MPRLNNILFSLLSLSCYNKIGGGYKSSSLLIVWRDRGEFFKWLFSSLSISNSSSKKEKKHEKEASILGFHRPALDGWGTGSSCAAAWGGKKINKYNPPLIIVYQFFQVIFISNSRQNSMRMIQLHEAYTKHTRKLKLIVFPRGPFF